MFCSLRSTKQATICSNGPTNKKVSIFWTQPFFCASMYFLGVGLTRIPIKAVILITSSLTKYQMMREHVSYDILKAHTFIDCQLGLQIGLIGQKQGQVEIFLLSRQPKNALIFQIYQCMCNLITYKYLLHQSACIHTIKTITLCKIYHFFFKNVIFHYFRAKSVTFDRKNGPSSVNTQPISIFFSVL